MAANPIPDHLRRYLLTSALTVPHVEAILLLRLDRTQCWDAARLAARLYLAIPAAATLLGDLRVAGVVDAADDPASYAYAPATPELGVLLDLLEDTYSKHLVAVTRLIHASSGRSAEQFAAAFRFRKDH